MFFSIPILTSNSFRLVFFFFFRRGRIRSGGGCRRRRRRRRCSVSNSMLSLWLLQQ